MEDLMSFVQEVCPEYGLKLIQPVRHKIEKFRKIKLIANKSECEAHNMSCYVV